MRSIKVANQQGANVPQSEKRSISCRKQNLPDIQLKKNLVGSQNMFYSNKNGSAEGEGQNPDGKSNTIGHAEMNNQNAQFLKNLKQHIQQNYESII